MRLQNLLLICVLNLQAGCYSQLEADFDIERQALSSCDERIIFENIKIIEADTYNLIYQLKLKDELIGSHIIYLQGENNGYSSGSNNYLILKSNKEYILSSILGDSGIEIHLFTNEFGEIDSVRNDFNCQN